MLYSSPHFFFGAPKATALAPENFSSHPASPRATRGLGFASLIRKLAYQFFAYVAYYNVDIYITILLSLLSTLLLTTHTHSESKAAVGDRIAQQILSYRRRRAIEGDSSGLTVLPSVSLVLSYSDSKQLLLCMSHWLL